MSLRHTQPRMLAAAAVALALHVAVWSSLLQRQEFESQGSVAGVRRVIQLVEIGSASIGSSNLSSFGSEVLPTTSISDLDKQSVNALEIVRPSEHARGELDEYLNAQTLSVRPTPLTGIELPEREMEAAGRSGKAVLRIFIDADGIVRRVQIDASDLPVEINDAVRAAVTRTIFRPGKVDKRLVKSWVRIEVVFETGSSVTTAGAAVPAI